MIPRIEYFVSLEVNDRKLSRVIIDQHYRINHSDMNDQLILILVKKLHGGYFLIEKKSNSGFEYFTVEPIVYKEKHYRLVCCLCSYGDFLGIINAFRVRSKLLR